MIHQKRIKLAPSMMSHGHGATGVLVVSKRAGRLADSSMLTLLQHRCYNPESALKTRWLEIRLSNDKSRQWVVNGNATGVTAVQGD
jgi:hypothetical protein